MKYIYVLSICLSAILINGSDLSAQNVGIGTNTPDTTAILDLTSTTMGFLPPRMNYAQRDAIVNPAKGLTIFNVEDSTMQYFNGQCWLRTYQITCSDCLISMSLSSEADTIDRVVSDSTQITITVGQLNGSPQLMPLTIANNLPDGMTVSFSQNPLNGPGTSVLTVHVSPITPAGVYPIIIQTFCGSFVITKVFSVTVEPCYILNINNSLLNYDMSVDLYNTYPSAPTNQPICVVAVVGTGVEISSNDPNQPAFTTGNLPAGSSVGIVNNGNILGKGGNGGIAYNPALGTTGAGFNGGNAINLTLPTTVQNNFNIYGGGGGGAAMAFAISYGLPAPININFGIFIGSGGGGGAGGPLGGGVGGLGGSTNGGVIGISYYTPGLNGSAGQFGVGGDGGILNFPIPITLGPVTIGINPNTAGGNGGGYGYPGTQGIFQMTLSASININIPFIGTVTINVVNGVNVPIPVPPPVPGASGFAIKRNGNTCSIQDNNYSTSNIKGQVGP